MFGLFKKKTELEKLQESYEKLLSQYHKVSQINRTEADKLMDQAEQIGKKMDEIKNKQAG
jgi:archaellum component FlaC